MYFQIIVFNQVHVLIVFFHRATYELINSLIVLFYRIRVQPIHKWPTSHLNIYMIFMKEEKKMLQGVKWDHRILKCPVRVIKNLVNDWKLGSWKICKNIWHNLWKIVAFGTKDMKHQFALLAFLPWRFFVSVFLSARDNILATHQCHDQYKYMYVQHNYTCFLF